MKKRSPIIAIFILLFLVSSTDALAVEGTQKWFFPTQDSIYSSPAIGADGTIYFGSFDGKLYALNPNGTLKWPPFSAGAGGIFYSSPAIGADGTIYVGSADGGGNLYAINPADGSQKWFFHTANSIFSSPAVGVDGTIYVGSDDRYLYAIEDHGTFSAQKWRFLTGGSIGACPAIGADGTIYVGSDGDQNFYAIKPNGDEKWRFQTPGPAFGFGSSPAIGADGTIYVGSEDGYLYAINPDGTQKWRFRMPPCPGPLPCPPPGAIGSSPAIGPDGTIYVGSDDHYLYAIEDHGTFGAQRWRFLTGGAVGSSPAVGFDGTIYVGSDDHKLYAIQPNGTQKWAFPTDDSVYSSPAVGADGTVYVGSFDNSLYAVSSLSLGLAGSPWPMFHRDLKHTGSLPAGFVIGQCGPANGTARTTAPTTDLCTAGTASVVSGSGPWTWTCQGANGGTSATCQANLQTWTVTPSAGSHGTISPNTAQTVNNNDTASFTVTPDVGYSASVGGSCGGSPPSGSAQFTYITSSVHANCTVIASFNLVPVDGVCGSANGGTFNSVPTTNLCNPGTPTAVSGSGHPWAWTCQGLNDGNNSLSCSATIQTHTVTPSISTPPGSDTISPDVAQTVDHNATKSFTISPGAGNIASVGGTCGGSPSSGTASFIYTTNAITANCTVDVSFTAIPPTGACGSANGTTRANAPTTPAELCSQGVASQVSGSGPWTWNCQGVITVQCQANIQTWIVTPSAVGNGTISLNTPQTVNNNATASFTVTPSPGYSASVGGTCGGSPSSGTAPFTYITNAVLADCTVVATFNPLPPPPLPVVTVTATDSVATEAGQTTGTFRISRTGPTTSSLSVNLTMGGTARNGVDYNAIISPVTISAGASYADITLRASDDSVYEGDETAILTISANAAYQIGSPGSATITIQDNDVPTVTVRATDSVATETGPTTGRYRITRTGVLTSSLNVYFTMGGTAQNGADYNTITSPVTIPAGASSVDVTLTAIDDSVYEGNETAILTISANATYGIGSPSSATITIQDNEPVVTVTATDSTATEAGPTTGIYRITRTGATTSSLSVYFTMGGTAQNGVDYNTITSPVTIPAGASSVNVTLRPINDSVHEGNETAIFTISANSAYGIGSSSSATITIQDND